MESFMPIISRQRCFFKNNPAFTANLSVSLWLFLTAKITKEGTERQRI